MDIRLLLVVSSTLLLLATAKQQAPQSPSSCSDQLVLFSPCLPYVSCFPNNLTDTPPPQCCDEIASAFSSGSAVCLCYLVQRPRILGFPVSSSKVLSLSSVCPMTNREGTANFSIKSLCSGKPILPPLKSITGPGSSSPHLSGPDNSAPPQMSPPRQSENRSSTLPPTYESPIDPVDDSPIGPVDELPIDPGVHPPTITVSPKGSSSTIGKICILCLCIYIGIVIFLVDIFI